MPLIDNSSYHAPFPFKNGHLNTMYPAVFRKVDVQYVRERIQTPDDDFLDLDWALRGSDKLVLVLHGLEASAEAGYVKGMIKYFNQKDWDGLAMNFRSCSGEMNRQLRVYHSGEIEDLELVLQHAVSKRQYREIVLIGFSLGGNMALKYLGEKGASIHPLISKGIGFSVPCDLHASSMAINKRFANTIYLKRFMFYLNKKLKDKMKQYPEDVQLPGKRLPKNFIEFDDWFTGPIHGFEGAMDYWTKCSCKQFLEGITVPTLLVNAQDDSFLAEECYPYEIAKEHSLLFFEAPKHGGHVGFLPRTRKAPYWSEKRAWEFVGNN